MIDKRGWLAKTFERSGAELVLSRVKRPLISGGRCTGVIADTEYIADSVFDCSGAQRALASHFAPATRREYALCYEETLGADSDFDAPLAYYDRGLAPGGYSWVFPKGDGTMYVGLAAWPWCTDLRERARILRRRLGIRKDVLERKGSPLFLGLSRSTGIEGLTVVGEANGSCDPYTGSGIFQAVTDAKRALAGGRRVSGTLRKISATVLRDIPAAYLQAMEMLPLPYVPYSP
jgi:digeranylgeranylglycerophospholipid reductase